MPKEKAPTAVEGVYEKAPGSGVWYVRYRLNGKLVRKRIGTRQAAIGYQRKIKTLISLDEGYVPDTATRAAKTAKELAEVRNGVTVGTLCDDLLAHIKSRPEEYRDQRNPPVRIEQIRAAFGDRIAESIRPYEISDWLDGLTKRTSGRRNGAKGGQTACKVSGATSNRLKAVFSALYRHGKHRDKVQVNPARDVKQRKANSGIVRFLTLDEEVRLRAVLQRDIDACGPQNEQQRNRVQHRVCELDIALGTGMRQGEQYGLRWTDVDFDREVITLHETKNGSTREVHMIADVLDALRRLESMAIDLPASVPGAVFAIGDPKKWWAAALRDAKIVNFRWHDLRHTFCSRLAQAGASLKVIQEAAGHKTIQMSARYAHLDKSSLANAMAVLNRPKP